MRDGWLFRREVNGLLGNRVYVRSWWMREWLYHRLLDWQSMRLRLNHWLINWKRPWLRLDNRLQARLYSNRLFFLFIRRNKWLWFWYNNLDLPAPMSAIRTVIHRWWLLHDSFALPRYLMEQAGPRLPDLTVWILVGGDIIEFTFWWWVSAAQLLGHAHQQLKNNKC